MKKTLNRIGAVVLAATLALGTLFLAPEAKKVSASTTILKPDIPDDAEWVEISGKLDNGYFEDVTYENGVMKHGNNIFNKEGVDYGDNPVMYIRLVGDLVCKDKLSHHKGTLYLDLNGFTISNNTSTAKATIDPKQGTTMYIFDSSEDQSGTIIGHANSYVLATNDFNHSGKSMGDTYLYGGTLKHGKGIVYAGEAGSFTMYGGKLTESSGEAAVVVSDYNTVNLLGGTIEGNSNTSGNGGGIKISGGTCTLGNCTITGNSANHGSGIYMDKGTFSVQGNVNVSGNTGDNVYLRNSKKISVIGQLTGEIGVTTETAPTESNPVTITNGLNNNGSNTVFFSDSTQYQVVANASGEAVLEAGNIFAGCRLILTGNIGIRYYLKLDVADQDPATSVTFNTQTVSYSYDNREQVNGETYFYFDIQANAAQMTDQINPVAHLAGSNQDIALKAFTVKDVADAIINGTDQEVSEYAELAQAMLDYGAAVQMYFGYNTSNLPTTYETFSDNSEVNNLLAQRLYPGANLQSGISFYGSSMLTLSRSSMRLYFKIETAGVTYNFANGDSTLTPANAVNGTQVLDDYYFVCLTDIAPNAYDTAFTVTINGDQSISYSPLNYCARVLDTSDTTPALKALARAMCNYYLKAVACSQ